MKIRILGIGFILGGLALLSGFLVLGTARSGANPLPVLGDVADFTLYDTQGNPVSKDQLDGKVWVVDFIFTTCGSICPPMTRNMGVLHRKYRGDDRIRMVSISVNPEYDTPEVLAEFARRTGADPKRWLFLTGARDVIEDLAIRSFKIGTVEEPIFHSAYFVLVDGQGRIRKYYDGLEKKNIRILERDIAGLLRESSL